jgi:hypothetical protein
MAAHQVRNKPALGKPRRCGGLCVAAALIPLLSVTPNISIPPAVIAFAFQNNPRKWFPFFPFYR